MPDSKTILEFAVEDLQPGMYVCELDRPWLGTPYLLEGMLIESAEDIVELARHCKSVRVDMSQSDPSVIPARDPLTPAARADEDRRTPFHGDQVYPELCSMEEELPAARQAHDIALEAIGQIRDGIERSLKVEVAAALEAVEALRESVIRNPDALLLLARLKSSGHALYDHALNASAHLLAFGRHLGLPREELSAVGLGGLLMDVGKLRLPPAMLAKGNKLSAVERGMMKRHVSFGAEIVAKAPGLPEAVACIVAQHHERENGSGYPQGLYANQLHAYARMASIVDCYEELVAAHPGHQASRPFQALKELRDNSRRGLNPALVEQFAHCIGLFPVGSLVELNTGEVAIVLTHGRSQRFLPRVMVILDPRKKPYEAPVMLDLRSAAPTMNGVPYEIAHDLAQGAYGIDPKQYYL